METKESKSLNRTLSFVALIVFLISAYFTHIPVKQNGDVASYSTGGTQQTQDDVIGWYKVEKIVDGDTINVSSGDGIKKIRLIGIDSPELHKPGTPIQCYAQEAQEYLQDLIGGKIVKLEGDSTQDNKDRYDRYLRYVVTDKNILINYEMVASGYAHEYTYDKPYLYQEEFIAAQDYARRENLGLWDTAICPEYNSN